MLSNAMWLLANAGNGQGNGPPNQSTGTSAYNFCMASYHDLFNEILLTLAFLALLWVFNKALS